ncbi:unnamed protein product, partial [Prorocentrum cordatum]
ETSGNATFLYQVESPVSLSYSAPLPVASGFYSLRLVLSDAPNAGYLGNDALGVYVFDTSTFEVDAVPLDGAARIYPTAQGPETRHRDQHLSLAGMLESSSPTRTFTSGTSSAPGTMSLSSTTGANFSTCSRTSESSSLTLALTRVQECNAQDGVGDEIGIEGRDLIIAFDGCGPPTPEGFDVAQKKFAPNLASEYLYQGTHCGYLDDGTVAVALEVALVASHARRAAWSGGGLAPVRRAVRPMGETNAPRQQAPTQLSNARAPMPRTARVDRSMTHPGGTRDCVDDQACVAGARRQQPPEAGASESVGTAIAEPVGQRGGSNAAQALQAAENASADDMRARSAQKLRHCQQFAADPAADNWADFSADSCANSGADGGADGAAGPEPPAGGRELGEWAGPLLGARAEGRILGRADGKHPPPRHRARRQPPECNAHDCGICTARQDLIFGSGGCFDDGADGNDGLWSFGVADAAVGDDG